MASISWTLGILWALCIAFLILLLVLARAQPVASPQRDPLTGWRRATPGWVDAIGICYTLVLLALWAMAWDFFGVLGCGDAIEPRADCEESVRAVRNTWGVSLAIMAGGAGAAGVWTKRRWFAWLIWSALSSFSLLVAGALFYGIF